MWYFSNSLYCKICGGTNLWFYKRRSTDRKSGWKVHNICKEDWQEAERKRGKKYYKTEKMRSYRRKYREVNRDLVRQWNKNYKKRVKSRVNTNITDVNLFHEIKKHL